MVTPMKIGIVGAGAVGGNLAVGLSRAGHDVSVANSRGPSTLADLAAQSGATPVELAGVAVDAEVVIVAVPTARIRDLPDNLLHAAAAGLPVVDTSNYYPKERDGLIPTIELGELESRWVSRQLGHPVIKAFNGLAAENILVAGQPEGTPGRHALPVAGDDEHAKQTVMRLVDDLGFDAVDAGGIDESWRQQPGTPSYDVLLTREPLLRALAEASRDRPAEFRY